MQGASSSSSYKERDLKEGDDRDHIKKRRHEDGETEKESKKQSTEK